MKIEQYKQQRQKLNLSQQNIANAINCNVQTISRIERGVVKEGSRTLKDYKEFINKRKETL